MEGFSFLNLHHPVDGRSANWQTARNFRQFVIAAITTAKFHQAKITIFVKTKHNSKWTL
jgi:hypothetical protein